MHLKRRDFIRLTAGSAAGAAAFYGGASFASPQGTGKTSPLQSLKPMISDIVPITLEERLSRIEKAQRLLVDNKIEVSAGGPAKGPW
jgi:hypothetical protein